MKKICTNCMSYYCQCLPTEYKTIHDVYNSGKTHVFVFDEGTDLRYKSINKISKKGAQEIVFCKQKLTNGIIVPTGFTTWIPPRLSYLKGYGSQKIIYVANVVINQWIKTWNIIDL